MRQEQFNFEDSDLKDALVRAFPKITAPETLRRRIENACSEATDEAISRETLPLTRGQGIGHWLRHGRRMAVAASIAGLGLGIGMFVVLDRAQQDDQQQYVSAPSPALVETALVQHDQLQRYAADPRLRQELLGYPQLKDRVSGPAPLYVPDPDLSGNGWRFVGAKPCQMDGALAAQLFYMRGPQALSVFVLPQGNYTIDVRGCPRASEYLFARSGTPKSTLFAVACSPDGKLTQREVQAIADELAAR